MELTLSSTQTTNSLMLDNPIGGTSVPPPTMRYLSLCSGIEAATVAWEPLGWEPTAFAEFDKFPSAVLNHHYPNTPNLGDITKINGKEYQTKADLIVGGTPCQSFSLAGLRGGLDDERGNLAFEFCRLVKKVRPLWFVWENVPGVLSSNKRRDFGSILGAMGDIGYGVCWRVLDAQFFGVAQRRRRIFVVGYLGDWRPATAVLFEPESLRGDPTASREKGEEVTGTLGSRSTAGGGTLPIHDHATRHGGKDGRGKANGLGVGKEGDPSPTLTSGDRHAVAFRESGFSHYTEGVPGTLKASGGALAGGSESLIRDNYHVRKLTPRECERLQGFPDDYTKIPYRGKPAEKCPDGPRYKACGNSMAVPVMRWIGERIDLFTNK